MVVNKKTEKNVQDDYYSNINKSDKNSGEKKVVVKKIKIRKKPVVKKKQEDFRKPEKKAPEKELSLEEKMKARIVRTNDSGNNNSNNRPNQNRNNNKPNNFNKDGNKTGGNNQGGQKRTFGNNPNYKGKNPNYKGKNPNGNSENKTTENKVGGNNQSGQKRTFGNNPNYKGNNQNNSRFNKPGENNNTNRKPNPNYKGKNPNYKGNNDNRKDSGTTNEKGSNITERGTKTNRRQNFGEDKQKDNRKKTFGGNNNRGGFGGKRGKFNKKVFWKKEEDTGFTRAKKTKDLVKEEKKIEDIKQHLVDRTGETIIINDILSVKEFSDKTGIALAKMLMEFMKNGMPVNINSKIDFDTACIISEAFDIKCKRSDESGLKVEDVLEGNLAELLKQDDSDNLVSRAPVVSIMGHVDHGKTSLLDNIRKSKVIDSEAGGITQSIGAYQVEHEGKKITFLDTPGHEAFTIMRARGARSTDIAILVVAADEGVKPQTIESISHAKEAGIPVIVAINKMDKQGANPDHVKGQLSEKGLTPEDWGGDTPMIPVSAKTGFGIDELLEMILLVSEMAIFRADPTRKAVGTVIEAHLDSSVGAVATVLINTGTLEKGDSIVCKGVYGKVKTMKNFSGVGVKQAGPSDPILLTGLNEVVGGGDIIQVVGSPEMARKKSQEYYEIMRNKKAASMSNLDMLMSRIKAGSLKNLKVLVKADSNGSLEAIKAYIIKLSTAETNVMIIYAGVGNITESDIAMAEGSKAILVGFNVGETSTAKKIIGKADIEYMNSKIIYHITERIEKIVTGMLDPKEETIILGEAKVGGIFFTGKDFYILGLILQPENKIEKDAQVNIVRKGKLIGKGKIKNLKSGTIDVKELEGPIECGIELDTTAEIEMKDTLEIFKTIIVK